MFCLCAGTASPSLSTLPIGPAKPTMGWSRDIHHLLLEPSSTVAIYQGIFVGVMLLVVTASGSKEKSTTKSIPSSLQQQRGAMEAILGTVQAGNLGKLSARCQPKCAWSGTGIVKPKDEERVSQDCCPIYRQATQKASHAPTYFQIN